MLEVYRYTHGDMNAQIPNRQFTQAIHWVICKLAVLMRIAARITTTAPTIQLFQEFAIMYDPYTHGEMKNQMPASKAIVLAARLPSE